MGIFAGLMERAARRLPRRCPTGAPRRLADTGKEGGFSGGRGSGPESAPLQDLGQAREATHACGAHRPRLQPEVRGRLGVAPIPRPVVEGVEQAAAARCQVLHRPLDRVTALELFLGGGCILTAIALGLSRMHALGPAEYLVMLLLVWQASIYLNAVQTAVWDFQQPRARE